MELQQMTAGGTLVPTVEALRGLNFDPCVTGGVVCPKALEIHFALSMEACMLRCTEGLMSADAAAECAMRSA